MLQEILGAAQNVSKIVADMAAATREQSAEISTVNNAIAKIDEMTGKNAVLVQENATAATALLTQTSGLSDAMNKYQRGDDRATEIKQPGQQQAVRRQACGSRR